MTFKDDAPDLSTPEGMDRNDFHIGLEFWCGDRRWRCTDVGTRVVVAICVDDTKIATSSHGEMTYRVLTAAEARTEGWFQGPPYAVAEYVFDEYDLEGCTTLAQSETP